MRNHRKVTEDHLDFSIERLPESLRDQLAALYSASADEQDAEYLDVNDVHCGDARDLLLRVRPNSVALSIWSPPYFVGKEYEAHLSFQDWQDLLRVVIQHHFRIIKPGGFLAVNIADILVFKDESMPRIQAEAIHRKRCRITKEDILRAWSENPSLSRYQLAEKLGCSEQTIDRRLNGNNIRGGKHETQTRVRIVGGMLEQWALDAGFYPYDRRIWVKDAAWENSKWASLSYRSVDEFEYLYFFWKPGITKYDRSRLTSDEWKNWGSRGVWFFPSVRANNDHEAKFPVELPLRVIRLMSEQEDIVLDCFMGSGTTAVAAIREGRRFIGIEIEPRYVNLARRNIEAERRRRRAAKP